MIELNRIYCEDYRDTILRMDEKCVDLILTDLPYGITVCKWDNRINLDEMWAVLKRISKDNCTYVFTASQPFTSILVMSNLKWFKYELIWLKDKPSNFMLAKSQHLKYHENILVFSNGKICYNPQMEIREDKNKRLNKPRLNKNNICGTKLYYKQSKGNDNFIYPKSYQFFNKERGIDEHPTQKPVALFEYLIKTYTNEGDLVWDGFMGSGTTAIACINLKRNFIGSEISQEYCNIANKRIEDAQRQLQLI